MSKTIQIAAEVQELKREMPFTAPAKGETNEGTSMTIKRFLNFFATPGKSFRRKLVNGQHWILMKKSEKANTMKV